MSQAREYFKNELRHIESEEIREFTAQILELAPDYFFTHPSSSSGKYHPPQSQGHAGLLRHTRSVAIIANDMCTCENITGLDRDAILSACLLHDICKYGIPGDKHTVSNHDYIGAYYIRAQAKKLGLLETVKIKEILSAVANHYGRWTKRTPGSTQQVKKYPEEYSVIDRWVHRADYLSSRQYFHNTSIEEDTHSLIG